MSAAHRLAGSLRVRPGQRPALLGGRPLLAGRLLRGQPAQAAAQRLPLLYSLCGRAHRITAQLAVEAALTGSIDADAAAHRLLREENRREHLRCFLLDWPRLLGNGKQPSAGLEEQVDSWFEGSARDWLAHWRDTPRQALLDWSARSPHVLARLLHDCRDAAEALLLPVQALPVDQPSLLAIGRSLGADAHFALCPELAGSPRETGAWTRLLEPSTERYDSAWLRLGARLADFVGLSLEQPRPLSLGALPLGDGVALAWSETARGLLLHRVQLEDGLIYDYQVLAPTEWNLHPRGTLACALQALPADGTASRAAELLLAVFDPCLAWRLDQPTIKTEAPCHA